MSTSLAISRSMPIADIVTLCPESQHLLAEYGLHCFHCEGSSHETLEEGCRSHGFSDEDIDTLVSDLNQMIEELPGKPATLTVTADAARAIRSVAVEEGHADEGLAVIVDGQGGFCMEFRKRPERDEKTFQNEEVPEVRIFASTLTLKRIGGSTVDFREGRFKLDLPEDMLAGKGCACGSSCSCKGV